MATNVKTTILTEFPAAPAADEGAFIYEIGRAYRGSARLDDKGMFTFRPFQPADHATSPVQRVGSGNLGSRYTWDVLRSNRTLKVVLTVREYPRDVKVISAFGNTHVDTFNLGESLEDLFIEANRFAEGMLQQEFNPAK